MKKSKQIQASYRLGMAASSLTLLARELYNLSYTLDKEKKDLLENLISRLDGIINELEPEWILDLLDEEDV